MPYSFMDSQHRVSLRNPRLTGQIQAGKGVGRECSFTFTFKVEFRCVHLTLTEPALEELSVSPGRRSLVLGRLGNKRQCWISSFPFEPFASFSSDSYLATLPGHRAHILQALRGVRRVSQAWAAPLAKEHAAFQPHGHCL